NKKRVRTSRGTRRAGPSGVKVRRRSDLDAATTEELLERGVDVLLVVYAHPDEALLIFQAVVEYGEQRARRATVAAASLLADLAVAEKIARLYEFVGEADGLLVVGVVVVAVREVERVYVPVGGAVALLDYVERELVGRRDDRAARLALREELLLCDFLCLRVVRDEDYLDVVVLGAEESNHPEEEGARDVLLELAHRAGHVHQREHDGVRLVALVLLPRLEPEVFLAHVPEARPAALARV